MIQDVGYLFFRAGISALYLFVHGLPRLLHFNMNATVIGIVAMLVEFGAALMVMVGFATRFMAAAIVAFLVFFFFRYQSRLPPANNEVMLIYIISFSAMAIMGHGRFSFDAFFGWFKRK